MGSTSHKGQALIETAIGIITLVLFISMGAQVSFILLKNFRHHHLEHQTPLKSKELPFEIMWSKDLMFFKKQSARKIEKTYKDNGWQVVQKTNLGTDILLLMEKDHEQILINNEMGVKL